MKPQTQDILIRPGMSEAIDPRMLPMGTPLLLQNIRCRQAARFEKRPGMLALATAGLPSTGLGCWQAEHGGLNVVGVEETLSSRKARTVYALADGATNWQYLGRHGVIVPERRFGLTRDTDDNAKFMSSAVVSGTLFVSWTDSAAGTTSYLAAVDPSGTVLRKTSFTADQTRLVYTGGVLYLVHAVGTALRVATVTTTTCAISVATSIDTLNASGSSWDAAAMENGTTWILAYVSGATTLKSKLMSGTTASVTQTASTTNPATRIGVAGYVGNSVAIGYTDGTADVKCLIVSDSTLMGVLKAVYTTSGNETLTYQVCPVYVDSGTYCIVFGGLDNATAPVLNSSYIRHVRITSASVPTSQKIFHFQAASKPFTFGAVGSRQVLIWAHNHSDDPANSIWSAQAAHFVLELQSATQTGGGANLCAVSKEHLATMGSSVNHASALPEVPSFGSGRYGVPLMWDDPGTPGTSGLDVAIFRAALVSDSYRWGAHRFGVECNGALHISGGCLYEIDDSAHLDTHYIAENGFPHAPVIAVQAAAGGALTSGKEYSYIAISRWQDAWGHVHRSAPSTAQTVTPSGGNLTTTVRVTTVSATGRVGSTGIAPVNDVYRSWDGGPFYYVGTTGSCVASQLSVTLSDTTADTFVSANSEAYTDGSSGQVVPNEPPSGARLIALSGTRMFAVGWQENVVQVSKLLIPTAPVEFCDDDAFRIRVPFPVTALATLDGVLVIFTERRIYLVTGDGPNDQGFGQFPEPRELPASVGCDDARSVVETPLGLMFQGAGTIWLLPRGFGQPQPIGDDVQETLGDYPYILSANMCANDYDECAHFLVSSSDTAGASRALVYNTRIPGWYVDTLGATLGAAGSVDGDWVPVLATWDALADVPVRQFSVSRAKDLDGDGGNVWITWKMGFGDWRPFGACGLGELSSILVLGQASGTTETEPQLNISLTVDGTAEALRTYDISGAEGAEWYREVVPAAERGSSYRLELYDSYNGAYIDSWAVNALAIQFTPHDGLRRLADTERK